MVTNKNKNIDLDVGLLKKDVAELNGRVEEIQNDIKTIKGYFVKIMLGGASVVGTYFLQWLLGGGLSHVVNAVSLTN